MKLARKLAITTLALSGLAIVPLLLPAQPAAAKPQGLQGSYVGVTVDEGSTSENIRALLEVGNQGPWNPDSPLNPIGLPTTPNANNANTGQGNSAKGAESQFQGRVDLGGSPFSARGTVFFVDKDVKAVLPMVSYDLPITNSANVYAGAGYAFVKEDGSATPIGSQDGVVITTGAEAAVGDGLVLYGDAKFRLNRDSDTNSPLRFQFGAGYRF